jgi:SAM-dependent methyltransferase
MNGHELAEEAAFADAEYSASVAEGGLRFSEGMFARYSSPKQMWDWRQRAARIIGDPAGKLLLDYGCGQGEEAVYFAKLGAKVTAIDVSGVGITITQERARMNGVAGQVDARIMDATATEFPPNTFDIVHGLGVLHHVGLQPGLKEVHRVLKPAGHAVFLEPLGNSRTIEFCKRLIGAMLGSWLRLTRTTTGEQPLRLADLRRASQIYSSVEVFPFHLLYRVRKLVLPRRAYDYARVLDYQVLRALPFLRHFAGAAVIHLRK